MTSFKPLFRLMVERNLSAPDVRALCSISPNTWTKIKRNEEVSLKIINKLCRGLQVTYEKIVEYIPEESEKK